MSVLRQDSLPPGDSRPSELVPRDLTTLFAGPQLTADPAGACSDMAGATKVVGAAGTESLDLENMQVVVRVRPATASESQCVGIMSAKELSLTLPSPAQGSKAGEQSHSFTFQRICGPDMTQQDYYACTAQPLVQAVLDGRQAVGVLMAYGISGSGKTHTVEGSAAAPGLLPHALQQIFQGKSEQQQVAISHCEVYNEAIYDLLSTPGPSGARPGLHLKENATGHITVPSLKKVTVADSSAALSLLRRSCKQRARARTCLNAQASNLDGAYAACSCSSSRSHSVVSLHLLPVQLLHSQGQDAPLPDGGMGEPEPACFSFVDLAGSERAGRTGNAGVRMKESAAINSSLMTLGRCMEALRYNQSALGAYPMVVPYRESKVTHLFRDVFKGFGRILLAVCISPGTEEGEDTLRVLRYAAAAATILTVPGAMAPARALKAISPNITKPSRKRCPDTAAPAERAPKRPARRAQAQLPCSSPSPARPTASCGREPPYLQDKEEMEEEVRTRVASEVRTILERMETSWQARFDLLSAKSGSLDAEQLQAQLAEAEKKLLQAQEASQQLNQQLESQLLQMQANAAMEQEVLQDQLDRAWRDNQALQGRLEAALGLTTALASACKSAAGTPGLHSSSFRSTPQAIALLRARHEAAMEAAHDAQQEAAADLASLRASAGPKPHAAQDIGVVSGACSPHLADPPQPALAPAAGHEGGSDVSPLSQPVHEAEAIAHPISQSPATDTAGPALPSHPQPAGAGQTSRAGCAQGQIRIAPAFKEPAGSRPGDTQAGLPSPSQEWAYSQPAVRPASLAVLAGVQPEDQKKSPASEQPRASFSFCCPAAGDQTAASTSAASTAEQHGHSIQGQGRDAAMLDSHLPVQGRAALRADRLNTDKAKQSLGSSQTSSSPARSDTHDAPAVVTASSQAHAQPRPAGSRCSAASHSTELPPSHARSQQGAEVALPAAEPDQRAGAVPAGLKPSRPQAGRSCPQPAGLPDQERDAEAAAHAEGLVPAVCSDLRDRLNSRSDGHTSRMGCEHAATEQPPQTDTDEDVDVDIGTVGAAATPLATPPLEATASVDTLLPDASEQMQVQPEQKPSVASNEPAASAAERLPSRPRRARRKLAAATPAAAKLSKLIAEEPEQQPAARPARTRRLRSQLTRL